MERDVIIERSNNLPLKALDRPEPAEDHQIWEGNDGDAHFKLTKEFLPIKGMPPVYALSVSGIPTSVEGVVADFTGVFGEPLIATIPNETPGILFCLWNAREVDEKIGKK